MGRLPRRLEHAIRLRRGVEPPGQCITPDHPHEECRWGEHAVEDQRHQDSRVQPAQTVPDEHPSSVRITKKAGKQKSRHHQRHCDSQRPHPYWQSVPHERPQSDQREPTTDNEPERTEILGRFGLRHEPSDSISPGQTHSSIQCLRQRASAAPCREQNCPTPTRPSPYA